MSNFEILRLETELKNAMDYIADQAQEIEKLKADDQEVKRFNIRELQTELRHSQAREAKLFDLGEEQADEITHLRGKVENYKALSEERADEIIKLKDQWNELEARDVEIADYLGCEISDLDNIEDVLDTHSNLETRIEELEKDVPDKRILGALLYLAIPGCYAMENREELSRRVRECFPINSISGQDVRDAIRWALERL
jgi:chromosome segregation ATPase